VLVNLILAFLTIATDSPYACLYPLAKVLNTFSLLPRHVQLAAFHLLFHSLLHDFWNEECGV
jgi:hypothetical protein